MSKDMVGPKAGDAKGQNQGHSETQVAHQKVPASGYEHELRNLLVGYGVGIQNISHIESIAEEGLDIDLALSNNGGLNPGRLRDIIIAAQAICRLVATHGMKPSHILSLVYFGCDEYLCVSAFIFQSQAIHEGKVRALAPCHEQPVGLCSDSL